MSKRVGIAAVALICAAGGVHATDYYVASDGAYEGAPDGATVYTTIDQAISAAGNADDVIHVEPGTYSTTTQYGPSLQAKLIGTGASRNDVVIQSAGTYRTLRMAAGSWLENVTVVGNTDITKVDKGGAIEMSGGTVTNCVVRDGTAKGNDSKNAGGNIYSSSTESLVVDCMISGGAAQNRGGNVCLDQGTLRACTITGGSSADGSENRGGNVWTYQGKIENCTISGGLANLGGNIFVHNVNASVVGGTISSGTASQSGGNMYVIGATVKDAAISGGKTTSNDNGQGGGNLYLTGGSVVTNCTVSGGEALNRAGSVFVLNASVLDSSLTGGKIVENASGIGGNVFMNDDAALVKGCMIDGGSVAARGGNVFMLKGRVEDCTIKNGVCSAPTDQYWGGGNVFMQAGTVSRCVVTGGSIGSGVERGGGFSVQGNTQTRTIEDCLIYGNTQGGIYTASSVTEIWNCTIVSFSATRRMTEAPATGAETCMTTPSSQSWRPTIPRVSGTFPRSSRSIPRRSPTMRTATTSRRLHRRS